jgi:hypothetical protein
MRKFTSRTFNYSQNFKKIDFRVQSEKYQVGRGEQGVLMVEPYKSEILPFWRFSTKVIAQKSAKKIYSLFLQYKKNNDFVGMDMARKFLQMGYTRSRRYANHSSGRKYLKNPQLENTKAKEKKARKKILPQEKDWRNNEKAQSARIFYGYYKKASSNKDYITLKKDHQKKFG